MDSITKTLPNYKKYNHYIEAVKSKTSPIMLSGLTDVAKIHFAYSTFFYTEKPILLVTYNEIQAKKLIKDLAFFAEQIDVFPKREIFAYDYIAENKDNYYDRMKVLNNIKSGKSKIVVTTIEALQQKIVPKKTLYKNELSIKVGQTIELNELKEKLIQLGYERYDLVEAGGQFSTRGGIVDIASFDDIGIRIEFWGDEVDSIRYFNLKDQRSTETKEDVTIYPAHEFVLEKSLEEVCEDILENNQETDAILEDIEQIKSGNYLEKIDKYFNSFYKEQATLIDYIQDDFIIFLDEVSKIKARTENILKDNKNLMKSLMEKGKTVPDSYKIYDDYIQFLKTIQNKQVIYLEKQDIGFVDKQSMHAKRNGYSFSYREVNFFRSSMDLCLQEIQKAELNKKTVIILGGSQENSKKLYEWLIEQNVKCTFSTNKEDNITPGVVLVTSGALSAGFESYDFETLVISGEELFNTTKPKRVVSTAFKQGETVVFSDLKPGDYVVHKSNGIGQFVGVNTIRADNIVKDYIKIQYRDGDCLYIPTNQLDNIRKYIGAGDRNTKT